jgi:hypothetical protein
MKGNHSETDVGTYHDGSDDELAYFKVENTLNIKSLFKIFWCH